MDFVAGPPERKDRGQYFPAPAGSTASPRPGPRGLPVHPRLRGTGIGKHCNDRGHRFIPAPAGNTRPRGNTREFVDANIGAFGSSPRLRGTPKRRPLRNTSSTVHPRACGEHRSCGVSLIIDDGSSPRLRGTLGAASGCRSRTRFIPAPAGNTRKNWCTTGSDSVHPRACGEHKQTLSMPLYNVGSSPRLRGTPGRTGALPAPIRFIPAPAGNTNRRSRCRSTTSVHPRACGEHIDLDAAEPADNGSSPRLRGTHQQLPQRRVLHRFIPAPAGNTTTPSGGRSATTVHPRACGEHSTAKHALGGCLGSSPRLRGTRRGATTAHARHRFIPAPAGNTSTSSIRARGSTVHPRACGEHHEPLYPWYRLVGSSPRLRGTRHQPEGEARRHPVHPRACGEHSLGRIRLSPLLGSSPRLRGTREWHASGAMPARFIPAPAGNTG